MTDVSKNYRILRFSDKYLCAKSALSSCFSNGNPEMAHFLPLALVIAAALLDPTSKINYSNRRMA